MEYDIDFAAAKRYALTRLERELSPYLHYHSVAHTRDDVVPAVKRLAQHMGISGLSLILLETAAWYHDIGYLFRREGHEIAGIELCRRVLPRWGYTAEHIQQIATIILATRLPQNPQNTLGKILADADLDSLGRPDFLETSLALRRELAEIGIIRTDLEWFEGQRYFLRTHSYFTHAARQLRDAGKQANIQLLDQLIENAKATHIVENDEHSL